MILEALRSTRPLCDLFESGARMRNDDTFPARQYMIGHAMRELINRLPDYYPDDDRVPHADAPDRRYKASDAIRMLAAKWRTDVRPSIEQLAPANAENVEPNASIGVAAEIVRTIDAIVAYEDSVPSYRRTRFVRFLAVLHDGPYPFGFDDVANGFLDIDGARHAHVPRPDGLHPEEATIAQWDAFEEMLFGVIGPRHEVYADIDRRVEQLNQT